MTYSSSIGISFVNPVINGLTRIFMLLFIVANENTGIPSLSLCWRSHGMGAIIFLPDT